MIFLSLQKLNEYCGNYYGENIIETKCSEKGCGLKGIKRDEFLIINGDKLESLKKSSQPKNSADCIIISKKPVNNSFKVVLCELCSNEKPINEIREKFLNSGADICKLLSKFNIKINEFHCIFLGKIKDKKKKSKELHRNLRIPGLKINNKVPLNIVIINKSCGYDINKI